jgi:hypothetical protein
MTITKRTLVLFAAACLVATGAFWAVMLTTPPVTSAAQPSGSVPVFEMLRIAPANLPVERYVTV